MRINYAHLRERSTSGGWIDFAVFEARAADGSTASNSEVLARLTTKARAAGQKIDQSALAYQESGRIKFFGDTKLVEYLAKSGAPRPTHWIDD
ncbi:hypothetical protein EH244_23220 [Variovorax beijingensis]|jgi:hypothetical protein|uniref:Uncharacterized protein n=1 Tax=Variovorax beijingensis TaxID=2496117 RepID=A0A3P3EIF8_9BURK|nr:hypothetical protein EH244_23220 [Variovorax beijingensis]